MNPSKLMMFAGAMFVIAPTAGLCADACDQLVIAHVAEIGQFARNTVAIGKQFPLDEQALCRNQRAFALSERAYLARRHALGCRASRQPPIPRTKLDEKCARLGFSY
jgi:hypothetical protein